MKLPLSYTPLSLSEVHRRRALRTEAVPALEVDLIELEHVEEDAE